MLRLTAALIVRLGLVLVFLALLDMLLPGRTSADRVVDDMALLASVCLVAIAGSYLLIRRRGEGEAEESMSWKEIKRGGS
jgi:hypothetical protein